MKIGGRTATATYRTRRSPRSTLKDFEEETVQRFLGKTYVDGREIFFSGAVSILSVPGRLDGVVRRSQRFALPIQFEGDTSSSAQP